MPISREKMALYPGGSIRSPEWLAIRARIRARAGDACENCGVPNQAIGGRDESGNWYDAQDAGAVPGDHGFCTGDQGERELRLIRIVCTVAHRDGELTNHDDENLAFWCQRCHNRHDGKSRAQAAAATRRARAGDLFGGDA